jgi:hypothetical protein
MTRIAICLLLALVLSACGSGASVTFHNKSDYRLEAVELSGSGFKATLGVIAPGQSLTAQVYPAGESGLAVSFMANGHSYSYKPQDYFEGGGMYKLSATVDRDLTVSVDSDIRP